MEVNEGGVKLLVNLTDYLDTGLFLDHRPLRARIAAEASLDEWKAQPAQTEVPRADLVAEVRRIVG